MVFSSFIFIFGFLPLALAGFLICARLGHRFAAFWLVLASLAFYAYWRVSFLPLLLISIAFNYGIGWVLHRSEARPRLAGGVLLFGVATNLLALFYYKYAASLAALLGFSSIGEIPLHDIVLPLGISFFTFTQIGYLVRGGCTLAPDAYLFTVLRWSTRVNIDLGKWPNVKAYVERVAARPKVQEAMKAEGLIQ